MSLNLKEKMTNYPNTKIHNTLPKILRYRSVSMPDTVALAR